VLTLRLVFHGDLRFLGPWSLEVMWALILVVIAAAAIERVVLWRALAVLAMGWMAMLSWGYEAPALVAGSMALAISGWALADISAAAIEVGAKALAAAAVAAVALLVYTGSAEVDAREAHPYYDRPSPALTASVEGVSKEFGDIRTSPAVAEYMHGLASCLERYPADRVAVIPDNPGLYAAMDLHNPFPIDWFWRPDYRGQSDRLARAARDLEARGDYLVLLQTVSGFVLHEYDHLPAATRASTPVFLSMPAVYDAALGRRLIATLRGEHVVCGSFLGIWSRPLK
jgi:hypothetical protein